MQKNKNNVVKSILILTFLSIFLVQLTSGSVEVEKCKDCHSTVKPMSLPIAKDCMTCHSNHGSDVSPSDRSPDIVHRKHKDTQESSARKCGNGCHQAPVECTKCHNSHERGIMVKQPLNRINSQSNDTFRDNNSNLSAFQVNISNCIGCHGQLPQPKGHDQFRDALSSSKHKWMNCRSCHINSYYEGNNSGFGLHFKDLFQTSIYDSMSLCKICHSLQYGKLTEGTHGASNKTCVDCHSPHTTKFSGPKFQLMPKETPVDISTSVKSTQKWITDKIPILNNPIAIFVIILVIAISISEYILSSHEEDTKVVYNMVKIQEKEDTLKTLEINMRNNNINVINDILEKNGINILGMTMTKEEGKDRSLDIYKYIIFINLENSIEDDSLLEKNLINKISSMSDIKDNIKSIKVTDKYEL